MGNVGAPASPVAGVLRTKSGAPVFPLGLGGAGIGSAPGAVFFGRPLDDDAAAATLARALERGINLFDTSPFYGEGERRLGLALRAVRDRGQLFVSTKAGTHPRHRGYGAAEIRRSVESSLRALGTDYLDVVHLHDPAPGDFAAAMATGGGFEALHVLRREGIVRHIGLGVRDHALHRRFIAAGLGDVILPYLDYNVLNRSAAALLAEADDAGVAVMLGSPLCMGLLGGGSPAAIDVSHYPVARDVSVPTAQAMHDWCRERGASLPALNFRFIRAHRAIDAVVVGAASPAEVDAALAAWRDPGDDAVYRDFCNRFSLLPEQGAA